MHMYSLYYITLIKNLVQHSYSVCCYNINDTILAIYYVYIQCIYMINFFNIYHYNYTDIVFLNKVPDDEQSC